MLMRNTARRYLEECEGECRWDTKARIRLIRVTKAATGWTIRMVERVDLVDVGRSKSLASPSVREAARVG